jgi:hypothetical protein
MRVGVFTETMLAAMALFTCPEWFDWLEAKLGRHTRLPSEGQSVTPQTFVDALRRSPARAVVFGGLGFLFLTLAWGPFAARRIPPPHWLGEARKFLWMDQPFGLFDRVYDVPRWRADGATTNGAQVEVLSQAVPDLVPTVRWRFSRWYKFTFKERERPFRFAQLGDFMCREYSAHTGQRLREFSLIETLTPPRLAGEPEHASTARERWHQVCP